MKKIFLILLAAAYIGVVFTGCDETGADVNPLMGTWSGTFNSAGVTIEMTEAGGFILDYEGSNDGYTATYTPAPAEINENLTVTVTALTDDPAASNLLPPVDSVFTAVFSNLDGSGTGATVTLTITINGFPDPMVVDLTMN